MRLFDIFKKHKGIAVPGARGEKYVETSLTDQQLSALVYKAIEVFENNPDADSAKIVQLINKSCNDKPLAVALYMFIPTAFCTHIVKNISYDDKFIVCDKKKGERSFNFSTDNIYKIVHSACLERIRSGPCKTIRILAHSSEFDAINNALNGGSKIEDLEISPVVYVQ